MSDTAVSPQLDFEPRKLLEIGIHLTRQPCDRHSSSIYILPVADYQIWCDRTHVAVVNRETPELAQFDLNFINYN